MLQLDRKQRWMLVKYIRTLQPTAAAAPGHCACRPGCSGQQQPAARPTTLMKKPRDDWIDYNKITSREGRPTQEGQQINTV